MEFKEGDMYEHKLISENQKNDNDNESTSSATRRSLLLAQILDTTTSINTDIESNNIQINMNNNDEINSTILNNPEHHENIINNNLDLGEDSDLSDVLSKLKIWKDGRQEAIQKLLDEEKNIQNFDTKLCDDNDDINNNYNYGPEVEDEKNYDNDDSDSDNELINASDLDYKKYLQIRSEKYKRSLNSLQTMLKNSNDDIDSAKNLHNILDGQHLDIAALEGKQINSENIQEMRFRELEVQIRNELNSKRIEQEELVLSENSELAAGMNDLENKLRAFDDDLEALLNEEKLLNKK